MAQSGLKLDLRRKQILELLKKNGSVRVTALCEHFGATPVTIRNDLDAMERDGLLQRVTGGAIVRPHGPIASAQCVNQAEKDAIAAAAARMIQNGDTLLLNSGTTIDCLAKALIHHRNLNIVTNSVAVAAQLRSVPSFHVILLGGELDPQYLYTCGGDAQEQLKKYQADYAILSLDGVSPETGITTYHADEAIIDRMMVEQAKKTWILADHTKLGRAGFSLICPLREIDTLITDSGSLPEAVKPIESAGVTVLIAEA